jgi:AcrR family transcriptional regulator
MTASLSARAIAREQVTNAILSTARAQLGTVGPAQLSVRAVAREVGMVSSAVYRYFPSRDELLTELLIICYDELGAEVEAAESAVRHRSDLTARWLAIAHGVRRWAVGHPHDYALLYGSPVPGYAAPERTVGPGTRVSRLIMNLLIDLDAATPRHRPRGRRSRADAELHRILAGLREFAGHDLPDEVVLRGMRAWSGLIGAVSLEIFGQLTNAVSDFDVYFDALARRLWE